MPLKKLTRLFATILFSLTGRLRNGLWYLYLSVEDVLVIVCYKQIHVSLFVLYDQIKFDCFLISLFVHPLREWMDGKYDSTSDL